MLEGGKIKEIGTYKDLIKNNELFSEFIGTYLHNSDASKESMSKKIFDDKA